MGITNKLTGSPIAVSARERMKAGGKVFAYRLHLPPTQAGEITALSDAIEAVEEFGWRMERMEYDTSARGGPAWMLVFRAAI